MTTCKGIPEEKLKTTNGCGSSYWLVWIFRIPKWFSKEFYCACCKHDIAYQEEYTLEVKRRIDALLISEMCSSANNDTNKIRACIKWTLIDIVVIFLDTKASEICFNKAKPKKFYFV